MSQVKQGLKKVGLENINHWQQPQTSIFASVLEQIRK